MVYVNKIYETIMLLVFLYVCDAWSVTLKEEHKLKVFENMVLRRIFGPKGEEMVGENCLMRSFVNCALRHT
jgi:hypothetical protein